MVLPRGRAKDLLIKVRVLQASQGIERRVALSINCNVGTAVAIGIVDGMGLFDLSAYLAAGKVSRVQIDIPKVSSHVGDLRRRDRERSGVKRAGRAPGGAKVKQNACVHTGRGVAVDMIGNKIAGQARIRT